MTVLNQAEASYTRKTMYRKDRAGKPEQEKQNEKREQEKDQEKVKRIRKATFIE